MEKGDHISLTLPTTAAEDTRSRKSLRRSWNQLPRCQRNLIILGISAVCVTMFLFLPGDQIVTENERTLSAGGVFPFRNKRDGSAQIDGLTKLEEPSKVHPHVLENSVDNEPPVVKMEDSKVVKLKPNGAPQAQLDIKRLLKPVPRIEEEPKPESAAAANEADDAAAGHPSIQEVDLFNSKGDVPSPEKEDTDRPILELVQQDPNLIPGSNGLAIADFLKSFDAAGDAQKQHFHGATNEKQAAVVAAFKHSWTAYQKFAWGHDNLKPISQTTHDWFNLGLTIVDSLDTMYIMGLEDEFQEARDWVSENLNFDKKNEVNLFEVTIRVLGGLLASYHLSGDKMFLSKSLELGNRLLPCFLSPSGIPYSDINLFSMNAHSPKWSPDSSTSEVTTLQLEFRDLSRSSNVSIYEKVVNEVNEKVHALDKPNGLVPIFINANSGTFRYYATVSLGARGDSYYEYLLKQWIQTGRKPDDFLVTDYIRAIDGVLTKLMRRTPKEQHVYIGELVNGKDFKPKMDHLTCYLPGTLLLGHKYGMPNSHLILARDLLETCYQTYMRQPTHLAPEITHFALNESDEHEMYVKPNDAHNLLRPEFIESLYYFYALTGNRTYQDMGWTIFQAFEKHTKLPNGYTSIGNVKNLFNLRPRDMMESFWLGETLKYFYLLFSDNPKEIDLDKWIFNTEAHPLPIRNH